MLSVQRKTAVYRILAERQHVRKQSGVKCSSSIWILPGYPPGSAKQYLVQIPMRSLQIAERRMGLAPLCCYASWDSAAMRVTSSQAANKYVDPPYRGERS
jgi:hypothetical protein